MTNELSFSVPLHFQRKDLDRREDLSPRVRRVLRRIAAGEASGFGDTSTLADPAVIGGLVQSRRATAALSE
jgi:hypothetical protein